MTTQRIEGLTGDVNPFGRDVMYANSEDDLSANCEGSKAGAGPK